MAQHRATRRSRRHDGDSTTTTTPPHLKLTNPSRAPLDPSDPTLDPWSLTRHQRLAAHLDSLRPRRGLPVTLNPSDPRAPFAVDFSLIAELLHNRYEYIPERLGGDDTAGSGDTNDSDNPGAWFTVRAFPSPLFTQLSRLQTQASDDLIPTDHCGLSPALSACLFYGLALINQDPNVARLGTFRNALDRYNALPPAGEFIYNVWHGWQYALGRATSSRKVNARLPDDVKETLAALSRQVGMHESTVAVVAVSFALRDCPATMASSVAAMSHTADTFTAFVDFKADMAAQLIKRYVPRLAARADVASALPSPNEDKLGAQPDETTEVSGYDE